MDILHSSIILNLTKFAEMASTSSWSGASVLPQNFESEAQHINVYLRLKPVCGSKVSDVIPNVFQTLDDQNLKFLVLHGNKVPKKSYRFNKNMYISKIYQPNPTQEQIFNGFAVALMRSIVAGENILLFTYGTTNAGKTFTIPWYR